MKNINPLTNGLKRKYSFIFCPLCYAIKDSNEIIKVGAY